MKRAYPRPPTQVSDKGVSGCSVEALKPTVRFGASKVLLENSGKDEAVAVSTKVLAPYVDYKYVTICEAP